MKESVCVLDAYVQEQKKDKRERAALTLLMWAGVAVTAVIFTLSFIPVPS